MKYNEVFIATITGVTITEGSVPIEKSLLMETYFNISKLYLTISRLPVNKFLKQILSDMA